MIRVTVDGILRVEDSCGQDLTPRGAKTKGLLALLVSSSGFRRSRVFLQQKLWSTRAPEQGSASLRQALTELRKSFGQHSDVVRAQHGVVELDESLVEVVRAPTDASMPFEDLNIRDPEFESWLRDIRVQLGSIEAEKLLVSRDSVRPQSKGFINPALVFISKDPKFAHFVQPFQEQLTRSVWEIDDVDVFDMAKELTSVPELKDRCYFFVDFQVTESLGVLNMLVTVKADNGRQLWRSDVKRVDVSDHDQSDRLLEVLSRQTCHALLELWRPDKGHVSRNLPLAMFSRSFREAFSFSRPSLQSADKLIRLAYSQNLNPICLAWQAFLRNTAMFEHLTVDFLEERDNEVLIATAQSEAPDNSFVLALAAQHSLVNRQDVEYGKFLCERAIDINSSNTLAWAFMSNIHSMNNNYSEALRAAEIAVQLSQGHPLQNFVRIFRCMALIGMNKIEPAMLDAQFASAINPEYQAIRRYLLASSLVVGRNDIAVKTLREIRTREPMFRKAEFLNEDYPVGTLRSMPIVDRLVTAV